ncbi:GTP pyrophosphokinase family protein [Bifidobacterium tissieri]|uniref:GTP pyrophosphokinase family protein n=1 Tax=Bifidobacterium tissieri TaxID=1630162 RepID=A0A5M9ZY03_9BIFI|nr:GTP pyrophosphokinase family protein [Bifidobacterium tissieri]KAA8831545.1 GTP pyrophosphokinase family protein [Bifidobacterium tissieri]KAA8832511.1 GTP pyrophosphokinase family protein [Bifidobacterium tissieri]
MMLERKQRFNVPEIRSKMEQISADIGDDVFQGSQLVAYAELEQIYSGAMREIGTKLENLDDEFQLKNKHNPIHHMECRLKSIDSTIGKLRKRNLPLSVESIRQNLYDIAGIRVICNYVTDVYAVANTLSEQSDIEVIRIKDYIRNPKPNGYRSLHVIYQVPVFLSDGPHPTPVEVQFRTSAMDYWASLEHRLRYKNSIEDTAKERHFETLKECARQLADIEDKMQRIHQEIG